MPVDHIKSIDQLRREHLAIHARPKSDLDMLVIMRMPIDCKGSELDDLMGICQAINADESMFNFAKHLYANTSSGGGNA
jgi:hypothetical protein